MPQQGTLSNALNFAKKSVQPISLDKIIPDPEQPRKTFSDESINELALSIKELGLIQPINVRKHPQNELKFYLVAGERRYRAYLKLRDSAETEEEKERWSRIEAKISDEEESVVTKAKQLAENVIREDLNPVERAEGLQAIYNLLKAQDPSISWPQVEKRVGISESVRKRLLQLNKAPEEIREAVKSEQMSHKEFLRFNKLGDKEKEEFIKKLQSKPDTKVSREKLILTTVDLRSDLRRLTKKFRGRLSDQEIIAVLHEIANNIELTK